MTRARARVSARAIIARGMCAIKFPAKAINCGGFSEVILREIPSR